MTKRQLKVKRKNPKYQMAVFLSTRGEMQAHPERAEEIASERSYRGKLVRNYVKRMKKALEAQAVAKKVKNKSLLSKIKEAVRKPKREQLITPTIANRHRPIFPIVIQHPLAFEH